MYAKCRGPALSTLPQLFAGVISACIPLVQLFAGAGISYFRSATFCWTGGFIPPLGIQHAASAAAQLVPLYNYYQC
jgi:hypothetical protein